jgi:hypothetical protein
VKEDLKEWSRGNAIDLYSAGGGSNLRRDSVYPEVLVGLLRTTVWKIIEII